MKLIGLRGANLNKHFEQVIFTRKVVTLFTSWSVKTAPTSTVPVRHYSSHSIGKLAGNAAN